MRHPKQVDTLATHRVVDIAVGSQHCLVLTTTGDVYGWGKNSAGEVDPSGDPIPLPSLVTGASKQGVAYISCGAHEVCWSEDECEVISYWLMM